MDCRFNDQRALTFDHIPGRGEKLSQISALLVGPWDKLNTELQKCELVCSNCHAIRTYERIDRIQDTSPIKLNKDECRSGHSLTGENLHIYKNIRSCKQCRRDRQDKRRVEERKRLGRDPTPLALRVSCRKGHLKTEENTYAYLDKKNGQLHKTCRSCKLFSQNKRYKSKGISGGSS